MIAVRRVWIQNKTLYISVPPAIIEKLGWKPGDRLDIRREDDKLVYYRSSIGQIKLRTIAKKYYIVSIPKRYSTIVSKDTLVLLEIVDGKLVVKPLRIPVEALEPLKT